MQKKYRIGLDLGTSSVKGVLCENGSYEPFAVAKAPFIYDRDGSGRVEIAGENYLEAVYSAIRQLTASLPENGEILSLCAASASGNVMLLGGDFEPLTPIISWLDTRTKGETDLVLGENFDTAAYYEKTGWGLIKNQFPLACLSRLRVREPDLLKKAAYVTMSTEYLLKNLTGEWGISTSAGTPFYLIDQRSGRYCEEVLAKLGIKEEQLPPVVKNGSVIGKVTKEAAGKTGLPEGTPVLAGTFDHPGAARGSGVTKKGEMLLSCGTSWVGFFPLESREKGIENKMLLDPFLSENGGPWAGMVSLAGVASSIDSYIDKYISSGDDKFTLFEEYAQKSEPSSLRLSFTKDDEKLISELDKPQIARAIMQSVALELKKDFDRLRKGGIDAMSAVMVGGPTGCPYWKNVIEEVTGIKVRIGNGAYAGAIGAANIEKADDRNV